MTEYSLVFVYGTLMKGKHNHHVMDRAEGKFISKAYIKNKEMFIVGGIIPGVIEGKGKVYGEIYKVPKKKMYVLDTLEGYDARYDDGTYLRRWVNPYLIPSMKRIRAQYYRFNHSVHPDNRVPSGDYNQVTR